MFVSEQVNIPLSNVTDVAIQKTDPGKTFSVVVVVGAAVFLAAYLIVCASGGFYGGGC